MNQKKQDEFLTQAAKKEQFSIDNDGNFPNQKSFPGDSVDGHEELETANALIAEAEIGQQNENL
ncbi:hypothetical protein [Bacillus dakarensis]|uniref:hypothetical protein n=1 Tax=Robertmurraya dakarensis TaxID=1926278 RepID=UPI000981E141|nr:hypothetical protein [Bacillus dakarensis]